MFSDSNIAVTRQTSLASCEAENLVSDSNARLQVQNQWCSSLLSEIQHIVVLSTRYNLRSMIYETWHSSVCSGLSSFAVSGPTLRNTKADDRRGLTEARLTEARFTEATCGISCARFRALVRPKRAQDSPRHERLRSCLTEARAHERRTRIYWKLHDLWNLIFIR